MEKPKTFPFCPSDFIVGTKYLSGEQKGNYIDLLCYQFEKGGIIDKQMFESVVGKDNLLRSKFVEVDDGFFNKRLKKEMDKIKSRIAKVSNSMKKSWGVKKNDKPSISVAKESSSITIEEPIEIPPYDEFKAFALENSSDVDLSALELKYKAWKAAKWIDGKGKSIKNWKAALLHTLPFLVGKSTKKVSKTIGVHFMNPTDPNYYDIPESLKRTKKK